MTRLLVGNLVTTAPASHDGRSLVRVGGGFVVGVADVGGVVGGLGLTVADGAEVVGMAVVGVVEGG